MPCCKLVNAGLFAAAVGVLSATVLSSGFGSFAAAQEKPQPAATIRSPGQPGTSLFDRLGGTYPIAALVDDYIVRLAGDATIMANPQVKAAVEKAAAENGLPGLKYQITAFIIEACGGPYSYHGKNMLDSHKSLRITQAEWDASVAVLKASLDKFKVPAGEQGELIMLVAKTRDQIVVPSPR